MNNKELNKKANDEFTNLTDHDFFNELEAAEQAIKSCKDPFDVGFYLSQQDVLNKLYGEIENSFGELNADLESYITGRKLAIVIESSQNKGIFTVGGEEVKVTSTLLNSVLSSLIRAEVNDLFRIVLILESKIRRIQVNLQTTRNHTYAKNTVEKEK